MYESEFSFEGAETFLLDTKDAKLRELVAAGNESAMVRYRGTPSVHEREIRRSIESMDPGAEWPRSPQPHSVAMHYRATHLDTPVWRSATLRLFANRVESGDLGGSAYIVVFTTRPLGQGHQVLVFYEDGVPVMFSLELNEGVLPKPTVQPTPRPEPAVRW